MPVFWAFYQNDIMLEKIKLLAQQYPGKDVDLTQYLTAEEKNNYIKANIIFGFYFFMYAFYLPFVAYYETLRYRASRMQWRGIRGGLRGSSLIYGLIGRVNYYFSSATCPSF